MGENAEQWQRYPIDLVGLTVEFRQDWPVQTATIETGTTIYQRLPESDGFLFVRYGQDAQLENYLNTFGDYVTKAVVTREEDVTLDGHPAKYMTVETDRQALGVYQWVEDDLVESEDPARQNTTTFFSLEYNGHDILIGYRLPISQQERYHATVKHFIESAELLE